MLRVLVNCDGEAIISNQQEIRYQIFDSKRIWKKLIYKSRKNSGGIVEIYVPDYESWIEIQLFEPKSEMKDQGKIFRFRSRK